MGRREGRVETPEETGGPGVAEVEARRPRE